MVKILELLRCVIEVVVYGGIGVVLCDYIFVDIYFCLEYYINLVLVFKFCKEVVYIFMELLGENVFIVDSLYLEGQIYKKMNDNQLVIEVF